MKKIVVMFLTVLMLSVPIYAKQDNVISTQTNNKVSYDDAMSEVPADMKEKLSDDFIKLYVAGRMHGIDDYVFYDQMLMSPWENFDEFLDSYTIKNYVQSTQYLGNDFGIGFYITDFKGIEYFKNLETIHLIIEGSENINFKGLEKIATLQQKMGMSIYYYAQPYPNFRYSGHPVTYDEHEEKVFMNNFEKLVESLAKTRKENTGGITFGYYPSLSLVSILNEIDRFNSIVEPYTYDDSIGDYKNENIQYQYYGDTHMITQYFNTKEIADNMVEIEYNAKNKIIPSEDSNIFRLEFNDTKDGLRNLKINDEFMIKDGVVVSTKISVDDYGIDYNGSISKLVFDLPKAKYNEYTELYYEELYNFKDMDATYYRNPDFHRSLLMITNMHEKYPGSSHIKLIPNEYISVIYNLNNPDDNENITDFYSNFNADNCSIDKKYCEKKIKTNGQKVLLDNIELKKENYKFVGWYQQKGNKKWNFAVDKTDKSITLDAMWVPNDEVEKYFIDVTFIPNNKSDQFVRNIEKNTPVNKPSDVVYDKHKLVGWFSDEALTKQWNFNTPVKENMKLYAKWEKESVISEISYYITYDGNGNTKGSAPLDIKNPYKDGESAIVLDKNTLLNEGYKFIGWNTQAKGKGTQYNVGDKITFNKNLGNNKKNNKSENIILFAQWKKDVNKNKITKTGNEYLSISLGLVIVGSIIYIGKRRFL
ncbi:MAG: InlB B-repeat-containing protein [Erysipelotrichales bacterium]